MTIPNHYSIRKLWGIQFRLIDYDQMITLASWNEPEKWVGRSIRISNSPKSHLDAVNCLIPPWDWVLDYRSHLLSEREFRKKYIRLLAERYQEVLEWMDSLSPDEDITLLCHELEDDFCHREVVANVIRLWRPDIEVTLH